MLMFVSFQCSFTSTVPNTKRFKRTLYYDTDTQNNNHVIIIKRSFEPFCVFGSCFRTLAVILFVCCCFLRPQRWYRLLGTGSPGRPPLLSHSS